jgi:hypothetical protein
MTDLTIKPEEIVEGGEYAVTISATAKERDPAGGWRFLIDRSFNDLHLTRKSLAAATITRHQREPQVGDVGHAYRVDHDWEIVAVRRRNSCTPVLFLWDGTSAGNCDASDFTVTKRAGQ